MNAEEIAKTVVPDEIAKHAKNIDAIIAKLTDVGTQVGLKLLAAVVFWIVGRWLINKSTSLIQKALTHQKIDATLSRYIASFLGVTLNVVLVIAILGYFGVETTTFAALVAAAGIAIGAAWGGLLANFAAGAFLIILRPFKVGDFVTAGGVTGEIREIGLFATTITTPDNIVTIVGNNQIFGGTIQNFTANAYRRVELVAQIAHSVDHRDAMQRLKARLSQIPNVLTDPSPDVEILEFNASGALLAVRPYCHNNHYWQVYFDTNRTIRETFGEAGYPVPEQPMAMRSV
ncbi:MAG: mechanosensitive ion channel family protein [Gammaproteobacteria bacterium]|nr:mechanosensitive ion channel family protein [Gammaproteobacteria bacterium]